MREAEQPLSAARLAAATDYLYRFSNVEFDESSRTLTVDGRRVVTEPLPLELLVQLLLRPNEVVTHSELQRAVWQGRPTVPHVVTSAINKLRKALGSASKCIKTQHGVGYIFVAPLERMAVGRREAASALALQSGRPVPGRVGWRLTRRLSGGGDIEVWRATHAASAATRVYKFGAGGDSLAALKREYTIGRALRQELGERDDFVRLLTANLLDSPYFLEYDDGGVDLAAWASEQGRLNALAREERIDLFLQIARAVSAAQGVGVLHKDLKPANVLVTPGPQGLIVRLTDFGNSRFVEPGLLATLGITALGMTISEDDRLQELAATPLYMAPELLLGRPYTMASDVYALGIMLYQVLVGDLRRPMSTGWSRDIDDPLLVADVTMCTEGSPQDRLGSAGELVTRLSTLKQRRADRNLLLRQETEAAAAAALLVRIDARRPWVRAAIASLLVGLVACLAFFAQTRAALIRAEQETLRAQSINDFLNKDVLQSAEVMRIGTNKAVSMVDVLDRASKNAVKRFAGQPKTEASVRAQLGETYLRLGWANQARVEFRSALSLLGPLLPMTDPDLLLLHFEAARCLTGKFMPKEAMAELAAVEAQTRPELMQQDGMFAMRATQSKVDILMDSQKNGEALPFANRLVALSDKVAGADLSDRFEARQRLSEIYLRLGDQAKADALLAEIMRPPYQEDRVGSVMYASARLQQARQKIEEGKLDEAEPLLLKIRETMTTAFGPLGLHVGIANSELGDLYQSRGDFGAAMAALASAAAAFTASLGEQHSYSVITRANLGMITLELGHAAEALKQLDEARSLLAQNPLTRSTLSGIDFARARALNSLGRAAEALQILKALDTDAFAQSIWGPRDQRWEQQAETGRALLQLGRQDEADALLSTAVAGLKASGAHPWLIARYRALLPTQHITSRKKTTG